MTLGAAAGIAASFSLNTTDASINATALQQRLVETGQVLSLALPGNEWYAWKEDWEVVSTTTTGGDASSSSSSSSSAAAAAAAAAAAGTAVRAKQTAVLKKEFLESDKLPPSEVREFAKGTVVELAGPPTQSEEKDYWLVQVAQAL